MSGQYAITVRRKKEANDPKRGAVHQDRAREIVIAVREGGGGDTDSNIRLRMVLTRPAVWACSGRRRSIALSSKGDDKDAEEISCRSSMKVTVPTASRCLSMWSLTTATVRWRQCGTR